jgi:hypothetical protein
MLSFSKILVLVVICIAAWVVLSRLRGGGGAKVSDAPPKRLKAEDTVRCSVCGTFIAEGTGPCGRSDCPLG